jgi:hypothetical protein
MFSILRVSVLTFSPLISPPPWSPSSQPITLIAVPSVWMTVCTYFTNIPAHIRSFMVHLGKCIYASLVHSSGAGRRCKWSNPLTTKRRVFVSRLLPHPPPLQDTAIPSSTLTTSGPGGSRTSYSDCSASRGSRR